MTYRIREIVDMNLDQVWNLHEGEHEVIFDGDASPTVCTRRRLMLSWFFWELHRQYPTVPVPVEHYYTPKRFVKGAEIRMIEKIFWWVYNHLDNPSQETFEGMSETVYRSLNALHNFTVSHLSEYITSTSLIDLAEVCLHPQIKSIKEGVQAKLLTDEGGPEDIGIAYGEMNKILNSDTPELRNNGICKMIRANILKMNQVNQLIGPRGYITSVNGDMFPRPILDGYADGIRDLEGLLIDSQPATVALYRTQDDLQNNEYFNRRMQLLTSIISRIEGEDCGTVHTVEWTVSEDDLNSMEGKYYYEGKSDELKCISSKDRELIGKTIRLRSMLTCCNEDPTTVCKTCLGKVWRVMNSGTVIGHFPTSDIISEISQLLLSYKHVIASSSAIKLELFGKVKAWLKHDPNSEYTIRMNTSCSSNNLLLKVHLKEVYGLTAIQNCENPDNIPPQKISRITEAALALADDNGNIVGNYEVINCKLEGVGSSLAVDVNTAIHQGHYSVDGEMLVIQLRNFKGKKVLETPMRSEDIATYAKAVRFFLFGSETGQKNAASTEKRMDCISRYSNAGQALYSLLTLLQQHLRVSILHAELFVRSCMTRDCHNGDFSLPKGGEPFYFAKAKDIIMYRCLSAGLLYENQKNMLTNPMTYNKSVAHEHMLDCLF